MRKQIGFFLMGIMVMMLSVSCGKEAEQEVGIDGYVNMSNQVSLNDAIASSLTWQEAGGKLYYLVDSCIYDVPVAQALEQQITQEASVTDIGDSIRRFCVDEDGNIYWEPTIQTEARYLHKHLAQSGEDVQIPLPLGHEVIKAFTTDSNGSIYLLLDNEILGLNSDGNVVSRYSGEQFRFRNDGSGSSEKLIADSQGNLFYLQSVVQDTRIKVLYQGTREWVELTNLPEAFGVADFFLTGEEKIFIRADDTLYEYDLKNAKSTAVLRFSESNLNKDEIRNIIYVDQEHLLAICMTMDTKMETEMYLLTRTPTEEVPQKTVIVLASLDPSQELETAVAEFNRVSEEYTVVINSYGTEGPEDDYEVRQAARIRLDSSLASSDPPDLLDMDYMLGVATYAKKDVLADLYPYFEKSDVLDIEDYLENVAAGYTVNGKLVCLPISVLPHVIIGRTSQVGSDMDWTFEYLNAVLEKYPDKKLLARNFMLYYFLYDYYINTFIDFETGKCNFDSDEFREFILWIERNKLPEEEVRSFSHDYVPEDVLLDYQILSDFAEYSTNKLRFGTDITLTGNITKVGTPSFMYQSNGKVGIVERSKYKDGAWAFLEYFISSKGRFKGDLLQFGFPTNREALMEMAQKAMEENREMILQDGSVTKIYGYRAIGDKRTVPIHALTQDEVDSVLEVIENIDFTQVSVTSSLDGIAPILLEELAPYYNGQKSLEEATRTFNNRIQLMVDEGM